MIEEIKSVFDGLTPILWASQICGIIGFIIIVISYQFDRKKFLLISGFAYIFFVLEQILAGLYSNMIVSVLGFIRNMLIIFFLIKKQKEMPNYFIYILLAITWIIEIIFFAIDGAALRNFENYLPPLLVTIYTLVANNKNYYILKAGAFVQEAGFMAYYLLNGLPFSFLRQLILVISIMVSVIIMLIKSKKEKQKNNDLIVENSTNDIENN